MYIPGGAPKWDRRQRGAGTRDRGGGAPARDGWQRGATRATGRRRLCTGRLAARCSLARPGGSGDGRGHRGGAPTRTTGRQRTRARDGRRRGRDAAPRARWAASPPRSTERQRRRARPRSPRKRPGGSAPTRSTGTNKLSLTMDRRTYLCYFYESLNNPPSRPQRNQCRTSLP
ncbi:hypothetical protein GQ55_3G401600 [Panicum hallii var. hallii]|uniref:Uncharacterized protein n=1 Tax=Panicum hallii var. hallii TaxID=1504633 RepID=A0A2T7EGV7_9POAL|nr:hypothetical protein GQ55_3G401600 [Panicum hallii var. hallii]